MRFHAVLLLKSWGEKGWKTEEIGTFRLSVSEVLGSRLQCCGMIMVKIITHCSVDPPALPGVDLHISTPDSNNLLIIKLINRQDWLDYMNLIKNIVIYTLADCCLCYWVMWCICHVWYFSCIYDKTVPCLVRFNIMTRSPARLKSLSGCSCMITTEIWCLSWGRMKIKHSCPVNKRQNFSN